jgi:hypothetical protein
MKIALQFIKWPLAAFMFAAGLKMNLSIYYPKAMPFAHKPAAIQTSTAPPSSVTKNPNQREIQITGVACRMWPVDDHDYSVSVRYRVTDKAETLVLTNAPVSLVYEDSETRDVFPVLASTTDTNGYVTFTFDVPRPFEGRWFDDCAFVDEGPVNTAARCPSIWALIPYTNGTMEVCR